MADEVARKATFLPLSPVKKIFGMPLSTCKLNVEEVFINDAAQDGVVSKRVM